MFASTTVNGKVEDVEFKATGKQILEPGWRVVVMPPKQNDDKDDDEPEEKPENPETPAKPKPELSADMKQFESKLETFFGTKVQLNPSNSGKPEGTIVIKYYSMDDLTRIQEIMENR